MSTINENHTSFLSNTLKRCHNKRRDEVDKLLQEGMSSLHLASHDLQQSNDATYRRLNVDPESYLLEEGDERSMFEPNTSNDRDFQETIRILLNWFNTNLIKDRIMIRSLEDDFYDGYVLGKLIQSYRPNIRIFLDDIPLSNEAKRIRLKQVLDYFESHFISQPIKWTFEQIYNRDLIATLHLLLAIVKFFDKTLMNDLPKNLLLKVVVVRKTNGLLQTRIVNERFIDDHERDLTMISSRKEDDPIDILFNEATPDKLIQIERILLNFVNNHLNQLNIHLKHIDIPSFQDGLNLLYLISQLERYFLVLNKYNSKKPISREQSHANLQLALDLMKQAGIDLGQQCQLNELLSGNQRALYRVLYQLYLKYHGDSTNLLQSIISRSSTRADVDSPFL